MNVIIKRCIFESVYVINLGLIKSTDHWPSINRPLTHRPTEQLTTDTPTHRPNNSRPNRQDSISKTWWIENIHFTGTQAQLGRCKSTLRPIWCKCLYKTFIYLHKIFTLVFFRRKLPLYKDIILNQLLYAFPDMSQLISTYGNFNKTRCFST